jgi:hypothetical protein
MAQNSRAVEWGLFLFSTFVTIVTLCNVIEYANLLNGPENVNFSSSSAQTWLIINIFLLLVAIIYWLYRVYHIWYTPKQREANTKNLKSYFLESEYTGIYGQGGFIGKNEPKYYEPVKASTATTFTTGGTTGVPPGMSAVPGAITPLSNLN